MSPGCLCAACPAQVSLTSKRVAKSSAAGARELCQWLGRWCSRCQCKCCQPGKAQGQQRKSSADLRGSPWWVQPLPNWFPYLRSEVLCSGALKRGHTVRLWWGGCAFSEDTLEHPLITSCEGTPPYQALHCHHPALQTCPGGACNTGIQHGILKRGAALLDTIIILQCNNNASGKSSAVKEFAADKEWLRYADFCYQIIDALLKPVGFEFVGSAVVIAWEWNVWQFQPCLDQLQYIFLSRTWSWIKHGELWTVISVA